MGHGVGNVNQIIKSNIYRRTTQIQLIIKLCTTFYIVILVFDMPYLNFRFSGNFTVEKIHVSGGGHAPALPRKEAEDPLKAHEMGSSYTSLHTCQHKSSIYKI